MFVYKCSVYCVHCTVLTCICFCILAVMKSNRHTTLIEGKNIFLINIIKCRRMNRIQQYNLNETTWLLHTCSFQRNWKTSHQSHLSTWYLFYPIYFPVLRSSIFNRFFLFYNFICFPKTWIKNEAVEFLMWNVNAYFSIVTTKTNIKTDSSANVKVMLISKWLRH